MAASRERQLPGGALSACADSRADVRPASSEVVPWIVIPAHNRAHLTKRCLEALQLQVTRPRGIVVVDDGSTDGTSEMVAREFPEVRLLRGDGDLWWSGAINAGVRHALENGAEWVLLLNDDTVPGPGFVGDMVTGVCSSRALYCGTEVDGGSGAISQRLEEMPYLPGRSMLVPRSAFAEVGFMAEDVLPQSLADYDFSRRAARSGYRLYRNRSALLYSIPRETPRYSLRGYREHLFSLRGRGTLVVFWRYARRNFTGLSLARELVVGTVTRVGGYLLHWLRAGSEGR